MDKRVNYLSLMLLDALEDENESDIKSILQTNSKVIDPSYVPQDRGIAPLHYVCGMQNERLAADITKLFLERSANPNCRSEENMTPLHVAAMYGRELVVRLLLQYGAELEVYDDDGKTPVIYAVEECNFEVIQIMKDHIFLKKYEKIKGTNLAVPTESKFENSLQQRAYSTPKSTTNINNELRRKRNKHLLKITNSIDDSCGNGHDTNKFTPNHIHYNYDVTSPYYINITHRRDKPQPKFPDMLLDDTNVNGELQNNNTIEDILSITMQNTKLCSPEPTEIVNIFSLTKENLKELTQCSNSCERSRISSIEMWREKVQKYRARQSTIKHFENIGETIDLVDESDHLSFKNSEIKEKSLVKETKQPVVSGDCAFSCATSSTLSSFNKASVPIESDVNKTLAKPQISLITLQQKRDLESDHSIISITPEDQNTDFESSYKTVPELENKSLNNDKELKQQNTTSNFIHSPKNNEYFLQMTEAYVHTDDENGLVFYETKLLSNVGNKIALQRNACMLKTADGGDMDSTLTSQYTNITLPIDYETDTLRAELTAFGEPPGPITKTTKKLYIKKLIKYKRKAINKEDLPENQNQNQNKFSVELQKTFRSEENFRRIRDYIKYDTQSIEYFEGKINKKQMREGHLKQSFIYMLIDPRISCNLPGESVYLNELDVWQRFLKSIFYVGKGKTIRPYSHLYDAMKKHMRLHNKDFLEKANEQGKTISIKKQPLNVDIFKSPPQKPLDSKKLDRILNIWSNGYGVVCLHVFHNILPIDAYTREAAIIDALGLQHLTNCKRGDYYGPSKTWSMKEKKYFGISLLFKAMCMYLAEGESQLSPSDLV